jgi:hypothetical protein
MNLHDPAVHSAVAMGGNSSGGYGNRQEQDDDE